MTDSHDTQTHGHLKVLCVDDNEDAADSLGEMLVMAGHDVTVLSLGGQGFSFYAVHQGWGREPS